MEMGQRFVPTARDVPPMLLLRKVERSHRPKSSEERIAEEVVDLGRTMLSNLYKGEGQLFFWV
jgi:hypothetical protein